MCYDARLGNVLTIEKKFAYICLVGYKFADCCHVLLTVKTCLVKLELFECAIKPWLTLAV